MMRFPPREPCRALPGPCSIFPTLNVTQRFTNRFYSRSPARQSIALRPVIKQSHPHTSAITRLSSRSLKQCHLSTAVKLQADTTPDQIRQPSSSPGPTVPHRKQLKDAAKTDKASGKQALHRARKRREEDPDWELTVGIELHAQLNTRHKLFSRASASTSVDRHEAKPNSHVAPFDAAIPGSQPQFQVECLVPAIRAALALGCKVNRRSTWDRKHYFWWDQPAGYQLTQFYHPLARDGAVVLSEDDRVAPEAFANCNGESHNKQLAVRIQRVHLEQDAAKTIAQPGGQQWIDLNRAGVPLIEIVSEPDMHHPSTAAAFVRKVQRLLWATDACVVGMEAGGLRADVNVSVRPRRATKCGTDSEDAAQPPLGVRTEIKNLSSIRAVRDAIIAERDRQIALLESGGSVAFETRGWTLGGSDTYPLRDKEGAVDYRYMPDPDLGPLIIDGALVEHLRESLGVMPDEEIRILIDRYGLSRKDAASLVALDAGGRAEYFYRVVDLMATEKKTVDSESSVKVGDDNEHGPPRGLSKDAVLLAANWILHELGRLAGTAESDPSTSKSASENNVSSNNDNNNNNNNNNNSEPNAPHTSSPNSPDDPPSTEDTATQDSTASGTGLNITPDGESSRIPAHHLASLLRHLHARRITAKVAKELLFALYRGDVQAQYGDTASNSKNSSSSSSSSGGGGASDDQDAMTRAIDAAGLWFRELNETEYEELCERAIAGQDTVVQCIVRWLADDRDAAGLGKNDGTATVYKPRPATESGPQKFTTFPQRKLMYLVGRMIQLGEEERIDPQAAQRFMRRYLEQQVANRGEPKGSSGTKS